ncbi:hypothetical protein V5O48_017254 [Marasmius crinis-equi]|uniref:Uncharacterized protein n=1 Tax=Marasmius crinis-equi TaxID=585013 RepID=A0ABR3EPH2_9AGAR
MSDFLRNARDFSIGDHATFNSVQGNQYTNNNYHVTNTSTAVVKRKPLWMRLLGKESEYDQYEEVKRGDVKLIREVSSHVPRHENYIQGRYTYKDSKCTKTVSAGQIIGRGDSMMTVVSYEGPEAQKEWKRDFKQCSSTLCARNAHLLGINQSKIPLLIFTSELIPAAQFLVDVGPLGRAYLFTLSVSAQFDCLWTEMWMDPQHGVLCRGPEGPQRELQIGYRLLLDESLDTPPTMELLQDDICTRFLVSLDIDDDVAFGLSGAYSDCSVIEVVDKSDPRAPFWEPTLDHFKVTQPVVVSSLTSTLVAVKTQILNWCGSDDLNKWVLLANGMTSWLI